MIYVSFKIPLIEGYHVFTLERTQRPQIQRTRNHKAVSSLLIFNLLQYSYIKKCQLRGCAETDCGIKKRHLIPITLVNMSQHFFEFESM